MSGSQKFISRNRAPRVQIEYDVELYGAQKKVQLPFVMGVMSDLSGKSEVPKGSVTDRSFLEIDVDNFDSRMKAMKPRAAFSVPNTLTGEGQLSVDLVFEKMSDFSPAEIARKVDPLRKLLEARTHLENLMTYMDGKAGAEELIERLVANPEHLRALALGASEDNTQEAAFDAMKAAVPEEEAAPNDDSEEILAAMAAAAPDESAPDTSLEDTLANVVNSAEDATPEADESAEILAGLAAMPIADETAESKVEDTLKALANEAVEEAPTDDTSANVLSALAAAAPEDEAVDTSVADALASVAAEPVEEETPDTLVDDTLERLAAENVEVPETIDDSTEILADMADAVEEDGPEDDTVTEDTLSALALQGDIAEIDEDKSADVLAGLAEGAAEEVIEDDASVEILANIAEDAPEDEPEDTGFEDALAGLASETIEDETEVNDVDALLADVADESPEEVQADNGLDDLLNDITNEAPELEPEADATTDILSEMAEAPSEEPVAEDNTANILAEVTSATPDIEAVDEQNNAVLSEMALDAPDEEEADDSGLDDLLADLADEAPEATPDDDDDLDALLGEVAEAAPSDEAEDTDLDDLLADMGADAPEEAEDSGLDDLLADLADEAPEDALDDDDDLDALLGEVAEAAPSDEAEDTDLDDLLADMGAENTEEDDLEVLSTKEAEVPEEEDLDLDALLASVSSEDDDGDLDLDLDSLLADVEAPNKDDAIKTDENESDDLDALLGDLGVDIDKTAAVLPTSPPPKPKKPAFKPDFGTMSAAKLQQEPGSRRKFRIAVLGDFSGRGNKGDLEIGAALGARKGFMLDFDTMEDVIARFRTTLTLPLGNDGSAINIELNELDDLHPDELFENVELFDELYMLRRDLKSGRNVEQNIERMKAWGGAFGDFKALSKKRSKGADAPADLRLTDFQNLIGDQTPKPEASATSDLISRIIGPHIVAAPDNGSEAMIAAVDEALSTAMSSVLHHPDFQSVEAAWRSLELLGRRVEASAELEVVVYDLSVEEFTADLAAQDDMRQSGLYSMLVEKPMMDESGGPISAVVGLYTWEETPTHAELLARMARISAHMDAPFISAISTGFMGTKLEERHPLVKKTWDALGRMPEAKYLGLASPRFMLRMPYGKKTEPLDRFDYEEFNVKEGMRSLLMANPALLVAVLLAETKARQGGDMSLGSIMSLNDMPFHYMTDQYGDQVALPCTERLLSVDGAAAVVARGFMPVLSVQGQNIVKLGSFQAVGGGELLGIWAGDAAKDLKSGSARMETSAGISQKAKQVGAPPKVAGQGKRGSADTRSDDGFESDSNSKADDLDFDDDDLDLDLDLELGDGDDLDDLLAGFGDDGDEDDDDMDADLAALLGDL